MLIDDDAFEMDYCGNNTNIHRKPNESYFARELNIARVLYLYIIIMKLLNTKTIMITI